MSHTLTCSPPQDSTTTVLRFLRDLFPDPPEDAYLVVSWPESAANPTMLSRWFQMRHLDNTATTAVQQASQHNVYFGVALRHPDCKPRPYRRGRGTEIYAVPGLWGDWDIRTGAHARTALPSEQELLDFLITLPSQPSLIVHTGGGLHTYHLFREPWLIESEEDRQGIATLLARFQYTIRTWAKEQHGWDFEPTHDLPRVLRLPGTINHKYPAPVMILRTNDVRYNPSEIEDWLLELPELGDARQDGHRVGPGLLDVVTVAQAYGVSLHKTGEELAGAHPVHGSATGSNLKINPHKHVWRCWRCLSGGDALYLIAVCEGLLQCEAAQRGAMNNHTDLFRQVVQIANAKFNAGISLHSIVPGPEPTDSFTCPELPKEARLDAALAAAASPWLDRYIAFSKTWAPRGYEGFHETVGVWVLETTAARRLKIPLGLRGLYTSNYHAFAARTTLHTKTTVADIGIEVLKAAGLDYLLAADEATPQAFLRSLTLNDVPANYDDLLPDERERVHLRLAFAAQRGWFYEEWGQHLAAMMRRDGFMAEFRGILRRLDDHKARYEVRTIARGVETLHKPYLALLANVTPADLRTFLQPGSDLWRDGFLARFTFDVPLTNAISDARFPNVVPDARAFNTLAPPLAAWHRRLGLPEVHLNSVLDRKGSPTGKYNVEVRKPLPEHAVTLSDGVLDAFYGYEGALRELLRQSKRDYLDGSYGRLPLKALRVAALLGSLENKNIVELRHWYRGQQLAERWREGLHRLMQQVQHAEPAPSKARLLEERILKLLTRGEMTVRELRQHSWGASTDEIRAVLEALKNTGEIEEVQHATTGRPTMKYRRAEGGLS